MKYKVSFYESLEHLLTERKANFVHKLKGLTTKMINELMKKISQMYDFQGTTGDKLVQFLLTMTKDRERRTEEVYLSIPVNGKDIPVNFRFICRHAGLREFNIWTTGACHMMGSFYGGRKLHSISVTVNFTLNEETAKNTENIQSRLINEIQHTVVHELAHAHDEHLEDETDDYKEGAKSSNEDLKFLNYYLKPTEIRSHLNQVFKSVAAVRHVSPKRVVKNFYKNADKAANHEEDPIPFTQDKKDRLRKGYANMVDLDNSRPSYDLAVKGLHEIISSSFRTKLPKSQRQFIIDYQIAFSRDFNPKMKERYYDKLFQGYEVPSLEQMNSMFEEVKSVFRGTVRIYNALKKKYYSKNSYYEDKWLRIENLFKEWEDVMWDNPKMTAAMKSNDPKKLKKAAKDTFDLFKTEMGVDKATLDADAARRRPFQRGNIFR